MKFRTERDPLGELDVPADAYYGVQTMRAVENFRISGCEPADPSRRPFHQEAAAAEANAALGRLDPPSRAPSRRRRDPGRQLREQFVVDIRPEPAPAT
jgi:aspartate ammonia-lyase